MSDTPLKKILIVDDEEEILKHLTNILKHANYEVISTTRGKEAVQLAKSIKPDLIILDILIPDMMGGEVQRVLSEDASTYDIPIIFLTGLVTKEEEKIIREKPNNRRLLAKPTTGEEVLEAIHEALAAQNS